MADYREFHCPYGDDFEGGDECDRCEQYELCMETPEADVIEIPKDATNGDMIKAMFGEPAKEGKAGILYKFMYRNGKPQFSTFYDYDWWNAPYKEK